MVVHGSMLWYGPLFMRWPKKRSLSGHSRQYAAVSDAVFLNCEIMSSRAHHMMKLKDEDKERKKERWGSR